MSRTFRRNSTDESASCFSEKLSNTESGPLALLASIVQMEKSCISSITSSGRHLQDRCSGVLQRASIPFQLPEVSHSTSIEMPLRTIMSCLSRKQRQFLETYDEKHDLSAPPKYTKGPVNTTERLAALRALITDNKLDGYLIPRYLTNEIAISVQQYADVISTASALTLTAASMWPKRTVGRAISGIFGLFCLQMSLEFLILVFLQRFHGRVQHGYSLANRSMPICRWTVSRVRRPGN